jgi:uncharacterized membrane protein YedE/YeeE
MTFYGADALGTPAAIAAAALVGLSFGFWLERAGFGSALKLARFFYFADFAVLQVMFTAMVTALLGLRALGAADLLPAEQVHQLETFPAAQAVGGLLFGVGFALGGWCPGTALVGLASGKLDALVFLAGAAGGSLLYAAALPAVQPLQDLGACGVSTLPEALGWSAGWTTAAVAGVALAAFLAIEFFRKDAPANGA